jgi:hypothetical protein
LEPCRLSPLSSEHGEIILKLICIPDALTPSNNLSYTKLFEHAENGPTVAPPGAGFDNAAQGESNAHSGIRTTMVKHVRNPATG